MDAACRLAGYPRGEALSEFFTADEFPKTTYREISMNQRMPSKLATVVLLALFLFSISLNLEPRVAAEDPVPSNPEARWWKGNLHTHSLWSDGDDFPEMIAEWYRTHGYNFLALSDHNTLSQGERWMKVTDIAKRGGEDALSKYQQRFGGPWVQTRGEGASAQVRLKPLDEFRYLVEGRGDFIMIPAEEVSDRAEKKPVHMNATNVLEVIQPVGGATVREAMANNLRVVREQEAKLGRKIMMHLNHPNFGWAVTAEDLAAVTDERFYEVYNGHPGVNHLGDSQRPSIERIWDLANTLRCLTDSQLLLGIATDDSHDYHEEVGAKGSHTGRGWVMVRSSYLTPEHLIDSLRSGDFYASSGVELASVDFDDSKRQLSVAVRPVEGETYQIAFIGSRKSKALEEPGTLNDIGPDAIGVVLQETTGVQADYTLQGDELFVRAVVTSSAPPEDPSFESQKKQAWTQPVQPTR